MSDKSKKSVTIDGVQYDSRCAAAKTMVSAGQKIADVAKAVGITYQTCYAISRGADKVSTRRNKYRAMRLAQSKREYTLAFISDKTGIKKDALRNLLKKNGIVPTGVKAKKVSNPAAAVVVA